MDEEGADAEVGDGPERDCLYAVAGCVDTDGLPVDAGVVRGLAALVHRQCAVLACDLEAFATHAKRKTARAEDVLLAARRNPALVASLRVRVKERSDASAAKAKVRSPSSRPGGQADV